MGKNVNKRQKTPHQEVSLNFYFIPIHISFIDQESSEPHCGKHRC
jgi:hypothetical protein